MFLRIFKYLLPRGSEAWTLTIDRYLRQWFEGMTTFLEDIKEYFDFVWLDIFPSSTTVLDMWENQFGLLDYGMSDADRRARLDAAWKSLGGQSPSYIQGILQDAGFDVYAAVGVKACATSRDPTALLVSPSYPLVNLIPEVVTEYTVLSGEADSLSGVVGAQSGVFEQISFSQKVYTVPTDTDKWPYFLYIADSTFPTLASVPAARRDEFETLLLKICPCHLWIGVMVNYV